MVGPVALVGFMGAGKSSVGARLAEALGLPFADSDAVLVARHGPIPDQLADPETFRDREEAVVAELLRGDAGVLATGGGAVLRPATRDRLAKVRTFWLDAPLDALARRPRPDRPLWDARVEARFAERRPLYAAVGERVDADAPVGVVVARILAALQAP